MEVKESNRECGIFSSLWCVVVGYCRNEIETNVSIFRGLEVFSYFRRFHPRNGMSEWIIVFRTRITHSNFEITSPKETSKNESLAEFPTRHRDDPTRLFEKQTRIFDWQPNGDSEPSRKIPNKFPIRPINPNTPKIPQHCSKNREDVSITINKYDVLCE